jgi:hypothetical protein
VHARARAQVPALSLAPMHPKSWNEYSLKFGHTGAAEIL